MKFPVPILMYHHVEPRPLAPRPVFAGNYVSRAEFSQQLDWLAGKGFAALTLREAVEGFESRDAQPRKTVALTFDDGCRCFLEHAAAELERRRMRATVFAVADLVAGTNSWDAAEGEREERLMSADELSEVARRGFEVGSHSATHADLTRIDGRELEREVTGSKERLEAMLDGAVETFCYPYARFGPAAESAVRSAGFRAAVSVYGQPGASRESLFALPRAIVRPGMSRLEFKLQATGWYELWQRLPSLGVLSQLRRKKNQA